MKSLVFDAGPVISLATNNLLWILEPLKKKFNGEFFITGAVKKELVDKPLETRRFKFEAIQVEKLIEDGILNIIDDPSINDEAQRLISYSNQVFKAFDNYMHIVHFAEMTVISAAKRMNSDAIVIDEKITRFLMENPKILADVLRKKLDTPIAINENNLKEFRNLARDIKAIRSVELVTIAYELGILDKYVTKMRDARKNLLESVLWGVKLNGCAITREEIEQILEAEK